MARMPSALAKATSTAAPSTLAVERVKHAIAQAKEYGLLGENILGTGFSFDLRIKEGAGAFVCGEETALIASIEGRRGEPRLPPPLPRRLRPLGQADEHQQRRDVGQHPADPHPGPRVVRIDRHGEEQRNEGVCPLRPGEQRRPGRGADGISLGDIVYDIGGGIPRGRKLKAVQTGGPLGGCIPASLLNTPIDYDSLTAAGATMGSGGMIVVDEDTCMVELAKFFPHLRRRRVVRAVYPLPRRRQAAPRRAHADHRGPGHRGRPRQDRGTLARDGRELSLRARQADAQPGPEHGNPFPRRSTGAYPRETLPRWQCTALVHSRCVNSCPAGVDVPAYLMLVSEGRCAEALAVHRERNPFAAICGRVRPAFCEQKCRRGEIDAPVAVRQVKRFMAGSGSSRTRDARADAEQRQEGGRDWRRPVSDPGGACLRNGATRSSSTRHCPRRAA